MAIQVKWFPTLVKRMNSKTDRTEVAWHPALTPLEVFLAEGFNQADAESVMVIINDAQAELDTKLAETDKLEFMVSIQGG